jgi:hypothetical protein
MEFGIIIWIVTAALHNTATSLLHLVVADLVFLYYNWKNILYYLEKINEYLMSQIQAEGLTYLKLDTVC